MLAEVVDRDDVGVFEAAGGLGFPEEAVMEILVADPQELDRDRAANMRIAAAEYHPHSAIPETVEDVVAADSSRNVRRRHGRKRPQPRGRPHVTTEFSTVEVLPS